MERFSTFFQVLTIITLIVMIYPGDIQGFHIREHYENNDPWDCLTKGRGCSTDDDSDPQTYEISPGIINEATPSNDSTLKKIYEPDIKGETFNKRTFPFDHRGKKSDMLQKLDALNYDIQVIKFGLLSDNKVIYTQTFWLAFKKN